MRFNTPNDVAFAIAEFAEDIWNKRHHILPSANEDKLAFNYRISISDDDADVDVSFHFHFIVSKEWWWFTVSDNSYWDIPESELTFREDDDNRDWDVRCKSYRHYAFSDLVRPMVQKKTEEVVESLKNPSGPYLWDTFPIREYRPEVNEEMVTQIRSAEMDLDRAHDED